MTTRCNASIDAERVSNDPLAELLSVTLCAVYRINLAAFRAGLKRGSPMTRLIAQQSLSLAGRVANDPSA